MFRTSISTCCGCSTRCCTKAAVTPAAGAPRPHPAGGLQRAGAPAQACSAIRCSCARRPAWTRHPSRASWPSPSGRRLRSSSRRWRTARASTRRARRAPSASTCRTSGRSSSCRRSSSACSALAPGVRLEAVAVDIEDIADALGSGALDVAVGFLPGLGPPVARRGLFRDPYRCLMRADHPIEALSPGRNSSRLRTRW